MTAIDRNVRTRTLARIVGPYLVALSAMLIARRDALPDLLPAFMQNAELVLATGAFTLMSGLVMVATHHHWTKPAAVVISLIGIVATLKGASLMIAPGLGAEMTNAAVSSPLILMVAAGAACLVGLWLTFLGWLSKS